MTAGLMNQGIAAVFTGPGAQLTVAGNGRATS